MTRQENIVVGKISTIDEKEHFVRNFVVTDEHVIHACMHASINLSFDKYNEDSIWKNWKNVHKVKLGHNVKAWQVELKDRIWKNGKNA